MKTTYIAICSLLFTFLCSCSENTETLDYLDNKLIEGTWYNLSEAGDSSVYIFKDDNITSKFFAKIIDMEELKAPAIYNYGNYYLTGEDILTPALPIPYKLSPDSKTIELRTSLDVWRTYTKIRN